MGAGKGQLLLPRSTQGLFCPVDFAAGELRALISLLHAHRCAKILQMIWFGMICRVAYRVVSGQGASDDRSDEEDE